MITKNGGCFFISFSVKLFNVNKRSFFNLYFEAQQDLNTLTILNNNTRGQTR